MISTIAHADPPQRLQVVREPISPGNEAAYAEVETQIAAACVALNCPHPHLALETLAGQKEIWWFNFFDSEEQRLQVTRDYESNLPLMEMLARTSKLKAKYMGQVTNRIARYRPDLGRSVWDLLGARYAVVAFGDIVIDAGGAVFEQADGTQFALRFFGTLEEARRATNSGATLLGIRPVWGLPAPEWVDADRDFWSVNPIASRPQRAE